MSDIQQVSPGGEKAGIRLNASRFLLAAAVVIVVLAVTAGAFSWYKAKTERNALEKAQMTAETFALGGYKNYLTTVDGELATKNLSQETSDMILFKKAVVMMDAVESDEAARTSLRSQARDIYRGLYETSASDTAYGQKMRAYAILGFLLDFNQQFFSNINTEHLPEVYGASYKELYRIWAEEGATVSKSEFQKLAFQTYIKLAHDPAVDVLSRDKTFISNRMYLTSFYLASFYGKLSAEERNELFASIKEDLEAYPTATGIVFSDVRHTRLVADFYYAYANGVYVGLSKPVDFASQLELAAEKYNLARKNVEINGEFSLTNATMGTYIDTYYLLFLSLAKVEGYEKKMEELVGEMVAYSKNEETKIIITRFYDNFLNGSWAGLRRDAVSLSKVHKGYADYLKMLGVVLE